MNTVDFQIQLDNSLFMFTYSWSRSLIGWDVVLLFSLSYCLQMLDKRSPWYMVLNLPRNPCFIGLCNKNIDNSTWPHGDTKFLFECWKIFHEWAQQMSEISFQHEKRNFVSPSDHVMFYLLYKHQWNTKPFYLNSFLVWKVWFIMKP